MRIAYWNIVDEVAASAVTVVTEIPGFEYTHVNDGRLSYSFRSSAIADTTVTYNLFGHGYLANTFALLGHNLTSSAEITFKFAHSNDWASPPYTITLTWNEGIILKFVDNMYLGDQDIYDEQGNLLYTRGKIGNLSTESGNAITTESGDYLWLSDGYEYMRLEIKDPTNPDGYIELGKIWAGTYTQITPSSRIDFTVEKKRSDRNIYGKDRQKFSIPGKSWRRFGFSFPQTENDMIEKIVNLYKYVSNSKSFIFCNFDTLRGYPLVEPCYCSIDGSLQFKHAGYMKFEYDLSIEEDM